MFKDRVLKVMSQVMNVPLDKLNEHSSYENVEQWDSLQHMNLVLALEEEFKMKFTDEEIIQITDVGKIIEALGRNGVED